MTSSIEARIDANERMAASPQVHAPVARLPRYRASEANQTQTFFACVRWHLRCSATMALILRTPHSRGHIPCRNASSIEVLPRRRSSTLRVCVGAAVCILLTVAPTRRALLQQRTPLPVTPRNAPANHAANDPQPTDTRVINSLWSDGHGMVWVVGRAGRAWYSNNHGLTFVRVAMPTDANLVGVTGRPGGPIVVATTGALYRSQNRGGRWVQAASAPREHESEYEDEHAIQGIYSDGNTLWVRRDSPGDDIIYTMPLRGRHLTRLPDRYDWISAVLVRRGAALVLHVIYNCHSGDYGAVTRIGTHAHAFQNVGRAPDAMVDHAEDTRGGYMTPHGDIYLLVEQQVLLHRQAFETNFHEESLEAKSVWASDEGEVLVTTPHDEVRRSTDHGHSFGTPVALP
jgi:hypothetical protein